MPIFLRPSCLFLVFGIAVTESADNLFSFALDKARIATCKNPPKCREKCAPNKKNQCVQDFKRAPDDCCLEGWHLECCVEQPTTTSTTPLPEEIGLHQRCKYEESLCLCGWGACIERQGWAAGGCCDEGHEFRCCQSESIVRWERVRTTDLVQYMQSKEQCRESTQMCLCGFEKVNHYIMGACCDDGSCLCCRNDPALFKLPEVVLPTKNTTECHQMPCNITVGDKSCVDTLSCDAYCVWNEGYKESECCKENYTAVCWNWAPRPAKMLLSAKECHDQPEIRVSLRRVLNFNDKTESYCASHSYLIPDIFLKEIKQYAGQLNSASATVSPHIAISLSISASFLMLMMYAI